MNIWDAASIIVKISKQSNVLISRVTERSYFQICIENILTREVIEFCDAIFFFDLRSFFDNAISLSF